MKRMNDSKRNLVQELMTKFGSVITRKQLSAFVDERGLEKFPHWISNTKEFRVSRGQYDLTRIPGVSSKNE